MHVCDVYEMIICRCPTVLSADAARLDHDKFVCCCCALENYKIRWKHHRSSHCIQGLILICGNWDVKRKGRYLGTIKKSDKIIERLHNIQINNMFIHWVETKYINVLMSQPHDHRTSTESRLMLSHRTFFNCMINLQLIFNNFEDFCLRLFFSQPPDRIKSIL